MAGMTGSGHYAIADPRCNACVRLPPVLRKFRSRRFRGEPNPMPDTDIRIVPHGWRQKTAAEAGDRLAGCADLNLLAERFHGLSERFPVIPPPSDTPCDRSIVLPIFPVAQPRCWRDSSWRRGDNAGLPSSEVEDPPRGPGSTAQRVSCLLRPFRRDQARSKRSRFMTLSHAATKSRTNFCPASSLP